MQKHTINVLWGLLVLTFAAPLLCGLAFLILGDSKIIWIVIPLILAASAKVAHGLVISAIEKEDERTKDILNSIFLAKEIFPDGWPSDMVELINGNDREKKNDLLKFGMKGLNLPAYAIEEKIISNVGHLSDWKITFLRAKLHQRFGVNCKKHFDRKFKDIKEFAEKVFDTYLLFDERYDKKDLANAVASKMIALANDGPTGGFPSDFDKMLEDTKRQLVIVSHGKGGMKNLIRFFDTLEVAFSNEKALIAKTQ